MPINVKVVCTVISAALVAGCASGPTGLESPKHPYDFRGYSGYDTESLALAAAVKVLDDDAKACRSTSDKTCRNKVVGELKGYIDDYWRRFKSDFNGRVGVANVAFDGSTSILTSAAAITTPESAKNILAALATSLLAIRSSAQKNLLGDQTAIVLVGQMDSDRLVIGARIDAGLDSPIENYSFNHAMSDLAEYGTSMSVISALVSLQRAGGANAQKLKDEQANVLIESEKLKAAKLRKETAALK